MLRQTNSGPAEEEEDVELGVDGTELVSSTAAQPQKKRRKSLKSAAAIRAQLGVDVNALEDEEDASVSNVVGKALTKLLAGAGSDFWNGREVARGLKKAPKQKKKRSRATVDEYSLGSSTTTQEGQQEKPLKRHAPEPSSLRASKVAVASNSARPKQRVDTTRTMEKPNKKGVKKTRGDGGLFHADDSLWKD